MTKSMRKNSKGGSKRRGDKYPGLNPEMHPKNRAEYIDFEYVKKLSDEEKAWLSKFSDEYYGATFAKVGDWNGRRKDFHRLKKDRKACEHRNNSRNRDTLSLNKSLGRVDDLDNKLIQATQVKNNNPGDHEDRVIELLDLKMQAEEELKFLSKDDKERQ
jgi:hypothetical protein